MSIQTEITRISGNVSDALDAIAAKGVTIPSGSNSDDMATLIGQISTGGNVETNRVAEIYPWDIAQETSTYVTADPIAPSTGYDAMAQVTVTIEKGTVTPISSLSATGATATTGTNTITLSKSVSNTPQVSAGYIFSGTPGNTSVSLTADFSFSTIRTGSGTPAASLGVDGDIYIQTS